jgi:hypothetical protein
LGSTDLRVELLSGLAFGRSRRFRVLLRVLDTGLTFFCILCH